MQRKEKDVRKPRPQQLVFSTKKVGRKAKTRQQQASSIEDAKPAAQQHQNETSAPSQDTQEPARHRSSRCSHSVKHMRPSRALLQSDHVTVAQCVRAMVERKTDAALLVDRNGLLTGILTDRDVAVKVVAVGRDPTTTLAHEVMTPDPSCVPANASAIDALKTMISGQFRHLPVTDNGKVVGILDIAKCLYEAIAKLEDAYRKSSDRLEETVKKLQDSLSRSTEANLFESLRQKLFLPTLSAIIMEGSEVPILGPMSSAMDAARLMLIQKTSAVMICNEAVKSVGIFTSKDLMRRVVAVSLEPSHCLLSSVMTPNPETATLGTTILETLHSMHNGQFLHVPVFDSGTKLVGIVDVLQVTHGVVQQMGTFQSVKSDSVQPLWDQFRSSLKSVNDATDHDEGVEDDEANVGVDNLDADGVDNVDADGVDIASLVGRQSWNDFQSSNGTNGTGDPAIQDESPVYETEHVPDAFVYKLADCYGNNHRFTSSAVSVKELLVDVQNRLDDNTIRRVVYVDDEGDHILLSTDSDLKDAVNRARTWGNKYIRLMIPHYRIAVRQALAHNSDTAIGMVVYAAAVAAVAGASFFLSRRK